MGYRTVNNWDAYIEPISPLETLLLRGDVNYLINQIVIWWRRRLFNLQINYLIYNVFIFYKFKYTPIYTP